MKLLHLSDLHLGKRFNEFSLIEDQKYILREIIHIVEKEKPEAVMLAGDIYDKAIPPAEAVELFDDFLFWLVERRVKVLMISGNHDSAERIAFGGRLMDKSGIYVSPVYQGKIEPIVLEDEFGKINFYLLPFLKPSQIRRFYPEKEILSYNDGIKTVIEDMGVSSIERNILICHQFVTGASRTESEEISVGGSDNVEAENFKEFDYVALGHLHRAQKCSSEFIRYSGTPLKYSFSEAKDQKSVTMVEIKEKGQVEISCLPLIPQRDLVEIKGSYNEVTLKSFYEGSGYQEDYLHITLTDEEDIPEVLTKLRVIYKNIMKLDYDNQRTRHSSSVREGTENVEKSPIEFFEEFYELQNGQKLSHDQSDFLKEIVEEIWEKEE